MKILFCSTRMGIGGAETHLLTLARELKNRGHELLVLSSGGMLVNSLEADGIKHLTLPLDKRDITSIRICKKGIIEAARTFCPDIVHAHGRIPAFICGKLKNIPSFPPVVTTAHGIYIHHPIKKALTYWGEKTIAVSEDIKDYLCKVYGQKAENITVIPNGVSIPDAEKTPHKGINILMCSRLDKGTVSPVLDMIRLIPALRNSIPDTKVSLFIAGDGDALPEVRAARQETLRMMNCEDAVTLLGPIADITPCFKTADLFVGSSRSLIEAMASGIPSIMLSAYENGNICHGLVTEENIARLSKINFLSKFPDADSCELFPVLLECIKAIKENRLEENTVKCREYLKKHHSIEKIVTDTLNFYAETLKVHRSGILLCGYFGAGNAGDDATLASVFSQIKSFAPNATVYATVEPDYKANGALPDGIIPLEKNRFSAIKKAIKSSRLFVLCGGSLLQNSTSNRSLAYYCFLQKTAVKYGCKTMIWGGGIGPLYGEKALKKAENLLKSLNFGGFRDKNSLLFAKKLTDNKHSFTLTTDPVLCNFSVSEYPQDLSPNSVVFTLRDISRFFGKKAQKNFENSIKSLCAKLWLSGFTPVFLPLSPEDFRLSKKLAESTEGSVFVEVFKFNIIPALMKKSACVLTVRLHGAVFADIAGVPCVAFSYDPKVASFASEHGQKCFEFPTLPDADTLSDIILNSADEKTQGSGQNTKTSRTEPDTQNNQTVQEANESKTDVSAAKELYRIF